MGPSDTRPEGDALIPDARKTQLSASETVKAAISRAVFTHNFCEQKNFKKIQKNLSKNFSIFPANRRQNHIN